MTAVRTAEHTADDGTIYTRVVFDLTGKKSYTITQSADKSKLTIAFKSVTVSDIAIDITAAPTEISLRLAGTAHWA